MITEVIMNMSRYNIRSFTVEQFLGLPPTVRYDFLEMIKQEYKVALENDPIGANLEKL